MHRKAEDVMVVLSGTEWLLHEDWLGASRAATETKGRDKGTETFARYSPSGAPIAYCNTSGWDSVPNDSTEANVKKWKQFNLSWAHEVGHQLRISTRSESKVNPDGHDRGPWPYPRETLAQRAEAKRGVMHPRARDNWSTEWLRHEDWLGASLAATDIRGKKNWAPRDRPPAQ